MHADEYSVMQFLSRVLHRQPQLADLIGVVVLAWLCPKPLNCTCYRLTTIERFLSLRGAEYKRTN